MKSDDDMFVLVGQVEARLKKVYADNLKKLLSMVLNEREIQQVIDYGLLSLDKQQSVIAADISKYWNIEEVGE